MKKIDTATEQRLGKALGWCSTQTTSEQSACDRASLQQGLLWPMKTLLINLKVYSKLDIWRLECLLYYLERRMRCDTDLFRNFTLHQK